MQQPKDTKDEIDKLLKILERKTDEQVEISEEELRKQRNRPFKKKKPKRTMVFRQRKLNLFLSETKIKPGTKFIEAFILHHYFLDWCRKRKNKLNPLSFANFTNLLAIFFSKRYNKEDILFFGINKNLRKDYLTSYREAAIRRRQNEKQEKRKKAYNKTKKQKS